MTVRVEVPVLDTTALHVDAIAERLYGGADVSPTPPQGGQA
jgi:hypothetical protein